MYRCFHCSKVYAYQSSLKRHLNIKHPEEQITNPFTISEEKLDDGSTTKSPADDDISTDISDEQNSSTDSSMDENESSCESSDEDETVWDELKNTVYNAHQEECNTKATEYMMDGFSEDEAATRAHRDMLDVYQSDLMFRYFKLLLTYHRLEATNIHNNIIACVDKRENSSFKNALRSEIHRRKKIFRQLLEDDIEDDGYDSDERYFHELN